MGVGGVKEATRSERTEGFRINKKTPHMFYLSVPSLGGLGVRSGAVLPELGGSGAARLGPGALSPLPEVKPSPVPADR